MSNDLDALATRLRAFRDARDWKQFHTLRNLIASISIEAGELLELTQWMSESGVDALLASDEGRHAIESEIADVFIYLVLVADLAKIDLIAAAMRKVSANESRYPVDKARGVATKHTKL